jgi:hypothetical protein
MKVFEYSHELPRLRRFILFHQNFTRRDNCGTAVPAVSRDQLALYFIAQELTVRGINNQGYPENHQNTCIFQTTIRIYPVLRQNLTSLYFQQLRRRDLILLTDVC